MVASSHCNHGYLDIILPQKQNEKIRSIIGERSHNSVLGGAFTHKMHSKLR